MDNKEKKLQTSNDDLIEQLLSQAQTNDEVSLNSAKNNDLDNRLNNSLDDDYKKQKIKQMYEEEMERTIDISEFDYLKEKDAEKTEVKEEIKITEEVGVDPNTTDLSKVISPDILNQKYEPSDKAKVITFENVNLKLDREQILRDINLSIHEGEFVYFVGVSGAGKSSMIKLIYRELKNTGGKLTVLDKNVTKMRQSKLPTLRRKVGVVFQDFKLLPDKTIYENVKFSLDVTGYPRRKKHDQVLKVLKQVGIITHKDKYPNELSGGQQQRAAIARAIVDEPQILVCDEPTGNLDPENAIQIMEIITEINEGGTTVLMATHDVGIVNKYKHRVVLMKNGRVSNEVEGEYIYE